MIEVIVLVVAVFGFIYILADFFIEGSYAEPRWGRMTIELIAAIVLAMIAGSMAERLLP